MRCGAGRESHEAGGICTLIADSFCCIAETNKTLYSNYLSIKTFFKSNNLKTKKKNMDKNTEPVQSYMHQSKMNKISNNEEQNITLSI